jgi:hypothetical protein
VWLRNRTLLSWWGAARVCTARSGWPTLTPTPGCARRRTTRGDGRAREIAANPCPRSCWAPLPRFGASECIAPSLLRNPPTATPPLVLGAGHSNTTGQFAARRNPRLEIQSSSWGEHNAGAAGGEDQARLYDQCELRSRLEEACPTSPPARHPAGGVASTSPTPLPTHRHYFIVLFLGCTSPGLGFPAVSPSRKTTTKRPVLPVFAPRGTISGKGNSASLGRPLRTKPRAEKSKY